MLNIPEILAPAGSAEQLLAAAACGADAVYLGVGVLNARRNAANFDNSTLADAVEYCHIRGMKLHLALNTVVLPKETEEAERMVETACDLGVDAIIVQDLGLAEIIRSIAPDMPLHASTQMSVHNLAGALALQELGFSRVVLAREMSRSEISRVIEGTSLETEVFIHGALCMCVSGQCYMSAIIGERSGNRGLCAQPCRMPFYVEQKGACELSLKDLSLVDKLLDLRELGVTSVKIEGRMKRPEYVAAAVTACKAAREGRRVDTETLQSVFSRAGFTQGYYTNALGADMFGVRGKDDVVAASGVLKALAALYRGEAPRVPLCGKLILKAGLPVELTFSDSDGNTATALGECPQQAINKPTTPELLRRSIEKLGGTPYYLEGIDIECEDGLAVPVSGINELRRSVLEDITALRARRRVARRVAPAGSPGGDFAFDGASAAHGGLEDEIARVAPAGSPGGDFAVGEASAAHGGLADDASRVARRVAPAGSPGDACAFDGAPAAHGGLADEIARVAPAGSPGGDFAFGEASAAHMGLDGEAAGASAIGGTAAARGVPALRGRFARAEQIPQGLADSFEMIFLPVEEAIKVTDEAVLARLVPELPRIDFGNYDDCAVPLEVLRRMGVTRLLAGNIGGVWLAKQMGFTPLGDWALNITNSGALAGYAKMGCESITASFELNLNDIKRLAPAVPLGIVAYGYLPLMITRNCPARNEKSCGECGGKARMHDRLGNVFTVSCGGGRKISEVFNCQPLYLADRLDELAGLSFITLYFTYEPTGECARVIREYEAGGEREKKTRGLYYRNIK